MSSEVDEATTNEGALIWREPSLSLAEDLCARFGIDPSMVTNMTINLPPCQVPTLVVEYSLYERGRDIVEALRSYELRESPIPAPAVSVSLPEDGKQ